MTDAVVSGLPQPQTQRPNGALLVMLRAPLLQLPMSSKSCRVRSTRVHSKSPTPCQPPTGPRQSSVTSAKPELDLARTITTLFSGKVGSVLDYRLLHRQTGLFADEIRLKMLLPMMLPTASTRRAVTHILEARRENARCSTQRAH
jgi:hypothetical protein